MRRSRSHADAAALLCVGLLTSLPARGGEIEPACADGVDNDQDGATDHPADPECGSPFDLSGEAASARFTSLTAELHFDNREGLEWLRLDASVGLSLAAVQAGVGGFRARGFRPATEAEVCALLDEGFSPCGDAAPPPLEWALFYIDRLGKTSGGYYFTTGFSGWFDAGVPGEAGIAGLGIENYGGVVVAEVSAEPTQPATRESQSVGNFLLREDPAGPGSFDFDGDEVQNLLDNCVAHSNAEQLDFDDDGSGDACDLCPMLSDPGQQDDDLDGWGDACDVCPTTPDPLQPDRDADAVVTRATATSCCCSRRLATARAPA